MDPLTHAALGAGIAHALFHRRLGRSAWVVGAAAGVLPDIDGFFHSAADPLFYLEYHRHFTHALVFVPVGGLAAALPWILRRGHHARWPALWTAALLAFLSHALLDAATAYGTQLLWPFSRLRVAWNAIAIVDPLFTLPLLVGVGLAVGWRRALPAAVVLAWCGLYLGLGVVQRERALEAQQRIAAARGDAVARGNVFPTLFNNRVWRSVYEADGQIQADRILARWTRAPLWSAGERISLVRVEALAPAARADPRVLRDFGRFAWFADGWLAWDPRDSTLLGDMRYSLETEGFHPLWGVRFRPGERPAAEWVTQRRVEDIDAGASWRQITGRDPAYRPLP